MPQPIDSARLAAAKFRFAAFFNELSSSFGERQDVLAQLALALLSREHVLLAGPPGTAKSALASAVLGRIVDEETGMPSLYARQMTESTVQTDVIGPIDFKTLMATGRTEHFTDEGLLGAVHAFLDEVFDGRDMLLRSTLNLLHERELKQGTRVTHGRFEVALMTTNRYVAEVLESSRETLLAFLDRIAFIGFVPRGFADPSRLSAVLRHEIGGEGRPSLEAPLTVQDLDALQVATDAVYVPDVICDGLARLLELLEIELSAAERADPSFLPTRYLSTRTAVRSGQILRAICMYDGIFGRRDRGMSVVHEDLSLLRLHLLLSGPSPEHLATLIGRERDPREKRQLGIVRSEREAFERAYAKLPAIRVPPEVAARGAARAAAKVTRSRSSAAPAGSEAGANGGASFVAGANAGAGAGAGAGGAEGGGAGDSGERASVAPPASGPAPGRGEDRPWAIAATAAIETRDPGSVARALRELIPHTRVGGEDAELAEALVRRGLDTLERRAMQATLSARAEDRVRLADAAREIAGLADTLDEGPAKAQALGRWVRGRALVLLSTDAAGALSLGQVSVLAWESERDALALLGEAEARLSAFEGLSGERARLVAAGVEVRLRREADAAWARGIEVVSEEVGALCDAALRTAATSAIGAGHARPLSQLLDDVGAALKLLDELDRRASAAGLPCALRTKVVGPRIAPLLAHTFGRVEIRDRSAYLAEVDRTLAVLDAAGLTGAVPVGDWLTWAARALLRAEQTQSDVGPHALDHEGYRRLRASVARVPSGFVLAEVALRTGAEARVAGRAMARATGVAGVGGAADVGVLPAAGSAAGAGLAPVAGSAVGAGLVPAAGSAAGAGLAPVAGSGVGAGQAPVAGSGAGAGQASVAGSAAGAGLAPVAGSVAGAGLAPVAGSAAGAGLASVAGSAAGAGQAPVAGSGTASGERMLEELPVAADLLEALPAGLRREVAAADRHRVERVVAFLERFWRAADGGPRAPAPAEAVICLHAIVTSRFFAILLDDGAASRTSLELELLRELFPEEATAAAALRGRLEALVEGARRRVLELVRVRGEGAWSAALRSVEAEETTGA